MCRCCDAHCIGASLNEGVNVVAPIILEDSGLKLFSMHTVDLLAIGFLTVVGLLLMP